MCVCHKSSPGIVRYWIVWVWGLYTDNVHNHQALPYKGCHFGQQLLYVFSASDVRYGTRASRGGSKEA
jgi:hypothetical protein